LHLLVIHNLPEMYTKFKARWLEQQANKDDQSEEKKHMIPIWQRVNIDGLTPLSLAAQLGRSEMFSFLLDERKITQWCYGPVACVLYPLDQLDIGFENKVYFSMYCFLYSLLHCI
jgi:ankyrin repeat protein